MTATRICASCPTVPRKDRRERVERGLYRAGRTYYACATPEGGRQAVWKNARGGRDHGGAAPARRVRRRDAPRPAADADGRARRSPKSPRSGCADQEQRVRVGDLRDRTLEIYELGLRRHALPELGSRQVRGITPDDLVAWHRRRQAEGYAADSIHAWWTPLRLVLGHAVRRGVIDCESRRQAHGARATEGRCRPPAVPHADRDAAAARGGARPVPAPDCDRAVRGPARRRSTRSRVARHRHRERDDSRPSTS